MKINEIIKSINLYLVLLNTKLGYRVNKYVLASSLSDARLIAGSIWGKKYILSVSSFSTVKNESVTQKQHYRQIKIVPPDERHQQYQRILSKKYVKALQFPPITKDDRRIALKNAITYLKKLKLINDHKNRTKFKE